MNVLKKIEIKKVIIIFIFCSSFSLLSEESKVANSVKSIQSINSLVKKATSSPGEKFCENNDSCSSKGREALGMYICKSLHPCQFYPAKLPLELQNECDKKIDKEMSENIKKLTQLSKVHKTRDRDRLVITFLWSKRYLKNIRDSYLVEIKERKKIKNKILKLFSRFSKKKTNNLSQLISNLKKQKISAEKAKEDFYKILDEVVTYESEKERQ